MDVISPKTRIHYIKRYSTAMLIPIACLLAVIIILAGGLSTGLILPVFVILAASLILMGVLYSYSVVYCNSVKLYMDGDDVIEERGILSHSEKKINVQRITDTSVTRSFIDKLLGAAMLNINTAGKEGYEVIVDCLSYSDAEKMHDEIYARMDEMGGGQAKNRGLEGGQPGRGASESRPETDIY
ncbi:MAG: PH domain-containing protein [Candidatus Micrarchaeota archaeon]|nr:PH domain-containing protein [Candidatus Micrarchaeota archaeon]